MDSKDLIRETIRIAIDKKGEELRVLDVSENLTITDYFVLVTVQNRRQAQALSAAIDVEMKRAAVPKARIEGYQAGWWVLLDFDTVVIHIFQTDARRFYDLDQLWADADDLTEGFLLEASSAGSPAESPSPGASPAKAGTRTAPPAVASGPEVLPVPEPEATAPAGPGEGSQRSEEEDQNRAGWDDR